jgi:phage anti-repressor protein
VGDAKASAGSLSRFANPYSSALLFGDRKRITQPLIRSYAMTSTTLIPVFTGTLQDQPTQLCNARDLHTFLQVGKDFSTWIKERIETYSFIEGEDYSPNLGNRSGGTKGRGKTDYHLTLDTAKELAMVENNEQGRQVRRYFIKLEKEKAAKVATLSSMQQKLLTAPTPDLDKINRINKRAWNLAQAAYENYRISMTDDPLVITGYTKPEEWQPIEASKDALELIRAAATTLAAASRAMNRRGDSLERLVA